MTTKQDVILDLVRENPGIRPHQIRELTGDPQRTVTWCLQCLRAKGVVVARDDLRDSRRQCYYTPDALANLKGGEA
ncbi:MAG: hypothetical protein ABR562_05570 [Thermoplasmatota archaeon]|nr:hypothetical protein [Halobacteriales archaeon]